MNAVGFARLIVAAYDIMPPYYKLRSSLEKSVFNRSRISANLELGPRESELTVAFIGKATELRRNFCVFDRVAVLTLKPKYLALSIL